MLLRTAVTNEVAAERMREVFAGQLAPTLRKLAIDEPAVRAGLVATQALGFALCRYILEFAPIVNLPAERRGRVARPDAHALPDVAGAQPGVNGGESFLQRRKVRVPLELPLERDRVVGAVEGLQQILDREVAGADGDRAVVLPGVGCP